MGVYLAVVDKSEYERLRQRPESFPLMLQGWRDLLFLHAPAPVDEVAALLPPGLDVDTFPDPEGRECAWVGLVPFWMRDIRAPGWPALPWIGGFCETNVRTYVHRGGRDPGVWFFSLDASRLLACLAARWLYSLNYVFAFMRATRREDQVSYTSRRVLSTGACRVRARVGPALSQPEYGSFEFFAVERYLLYSVHRGLLSTGRVWHPPYALRAVESFEVRETLSASARLPASAFQHAVFSEGADVEVFGLST